MVRGFFEAHGERISRIIADAFPVFERFHWTLETVDRMDFDDFILVADGVQALNQRDAEAIKAAQGK
ncbi:hypothetical protein M2222_001337 [Bradyrhizobium elkanii]|uniref:hypothetical protein n=1 Tax=Bradyrhizobium elkanii TaxID=29448 RepID=UPI00216749C8|nr:hypothetical protein [Bradyrhizobium elkanii]MCS3449842.1 hypothetical protein [Bradyrhizobium elkanii]MCS3559015.1 hypothetical protein [Bradyrhizobium elkanii]MCW2151139.1 hypothetical protein [Bradyrhizobium elkanii]MCW2374870.1 hypothetical protein [Bradyrhizobium elkanii]